MTAAVDVRDRSPVRRVFEAALDRLQVVDILIDNAGGSARSEITPFHQAGEEVLDRILDVNLKVPVFCMRAIVEHMFERRQGKIVNIGSTVGVQGCRNVSDHAAAKGGVIAVTKSLAMELKPSGININCVSPGIVPRTPDGEEDVPNTNYLGRICRPEDVANLVTFLLSKEAQFITGQNYIVDGGGVSASREVERPPFHLPPRRVISYGRTTAADPSAVLIVNGHEGHQSRRQQIASLSG